ncbi:hypothetical protein EVAR_94118_1 [Eumeta japonica]|uniref:Uncharacterized protein n=1 Tax=Eumeta variegata TaxID=151549 RepID=A0A4C1U6Y2_EUMVA|nr:hypothetical protein EVAR_94118_1 [Eumeta japonica]
MRETAQIKPLPVKGKPRSVVASYNARDSAAVKLVTKASQYREIDKRRRRRKGRVELNLRIISFADNSESGGGQQTEGQTQGGVIDRSAATRAHCMVIVEHHRQGTDGGFALFYPSSMKRRGR